MCFYPFSLSLIVLQALRFAQQKTGTAGERTTYVCVMNAYGGYKKIETKERNDTSHFKTLSIQIESLFLGRENKKVANVRAWLCTWLCTCWKMWLLFLFNLCFCFAAAVWVFCYETTSAFSFLLACICGIP